MMKLIAKLFRKLARTNLWKRFASTAIAHVQFRFYGVPKLNKPESEVREELLSLLKEDKIYAFTSADTKSLAYGLISLLTQGDYSHAGFIYKKSNKDLMLLHITSKGLIHQPFTDFCNELDRFCVLELEPINKEALITYRKRLNFCISHPQDFVYDFAQEIDEHSQWTHKFDDDWFQVMKHLTQKNKLFCSELVYYVTYGLVDILKLEDLYGAAMLSPQDVYEQLPIVKEYRG